MSGGYIKRQDEREHQVVIFTFAGSVSSSQEKKWNDAIRVLKQTFGASIIGVTLTGEKSPAPPKRKARRR